MLKNRQTNNLLNVEHLNVYFKHENKQTHIVKDLSFTIARGQSLALVGESGSGKTMTAMSIAQLLPLGMHVDNESRILLDETDVLSLPEIAMRKIRGKKIGVIFQEPMTAFNPVLTVGEQVAEVLRHHFSYTRKEVYNRVIHLLHAVGIHHPERCYEEYPHQLSGGMRQRVMIAMAIAGEPDLLIADEPTSAIDVTLQAQILKLIREIQSKRNMAMLFISHDLAVIQHIADDVAVMQHGEMLEHARAKHFFQHPVHPYSKKLISVLPQFLVREGSISRQSQPFLQVDNLKVYFAIQKGVLKRTVGYEKAVDGVSFEIETGKTLALIGESGSGKTTLGKTIVQLIKPYSGDIKLKVSDPAHWREEIQMIFQDPFSSLNPRMRVIDIIAEGLDVNGRIKNKHDREKIVKEALAQVDLPEDSLHRYPHEFSGGQRQRISIARALALKPRLIICDEPTSALDVSIQADILKLLRSLQNELNIAYLFITHNIAVLPFIADDVLVLHEGKVVEIGTIDKVLRAPQHPYTKSLLAAVPKLHEDHADLL